MGRGRDGEEERGGEEGAMGKRKGWGRKVWEMRHTLAASRLPLQP